MGKIHEGAVTELTTTEAFHNGKQAFAGGTTREGFPSGSETLLTPDRQALTEPAGHGVVGRVVELSRLAEERRAGKQERFSIASVRGAKDRAEEQLDLEGRGGLEDRLAGLQRSPLPCGHQGAVDLGRLGIAADQDADLGRLGAVTGRTDGAILTQKSGIHLPQEPHRLAGDRSGLVRMHDFER